METPDPPNDTPGALKQVVLTPRPTSQGFLGKVVFHVPAMCWVETRGSPTYGLGVLHYPGYPPLL